MISTTRKLKAVLGAATALSLMASSGALADGNFSNVNQIGSDNSGLVTQGGASNKVGRLTATPPAAAAARQTGNRNTFTFTQSGDGNEIGTGGSGFHQDSNRNVATITQSSSNNKVLQVTQTGNTLSSALGLTRNTLTITQAGAGGNNAVNSVTQTRSGSTNLPFVGPTDILPSNVAAIQQNGGNNTVDSLSQKGRVNNATATQAGNWNYVGTFSQDGLSNLATVTHSGVNNVTNLVDQRGEANVASITLSGNYNGFGNAWPSGHFGLDDVFAGRGLATVYQSGTGNIAGLTAAGDGNMYHFEQNGALNIASGTLAGNDNAAAVRQNDGGGNLATYTVTGHRNHVFIGQRFGPNLGTITITGNDNHQALLQEGINVATLTVTGNNNIQQAVQTGNFNNLNVTVYGNDNNSNGFTPLLPAALTAATVVPSHLTTALIPGQIYQLGNSNSISHQVGTGITPSDNNRYAFYQKGNNNSITGSMQGSANEAAVVQIGNGSITNFTQNGIGNIIGVNQ